MILKELMYFSQRKLESIVGCSFKRAHFYELPAGSFGFKFYAALSSGCVFIQQEEDQFYLDAVIKFGMPDVTYDDDVGGPLYAAGHEGVVR
jgi:hypothetical protein